MMLRPERVRVPQAGAEPQSSIGFGGRAPGRTQALIRPLQSVAPTIERPRPKLLIRWPSAARRLGSERRFLYGEAHLGQGIGRLAASEADVRICGYHRAAFHRFAPY